MLEGFTPWEASTADRYRQEEYWQGKSLGQLLRDGNTQFSNSVALIDGVRSWTYRELDQSVDRIASGLLARGIGPEDRVLVHMPNSAEFLQLCFALFRVGAVPVLALPAHREREILHLAQLSNASAYVVHDIHSGFDYRSIARSVKNQVDSVLNIFVVGDAHEFVAFASIDAEPVVLKDPDSSAVALLLLSGGTTGLPKLIPRTHDDYFYTARASASITELKRESRYLAALPIAHNFPLACPGVLGTLYAGGTIILSPSPGPDDAFSLIERHKVTHTALVPPLALLWMEAVEWLDNDLSSLRLLQVGGSRLASEAATRIQPKLGCKLQQVYGMAEGLLNFTRITDDEEVVLNTQGRPLCIADEVRIVDADDREVEPGELGELLTRGPYTIRGYYCAEEYNKGAFTRDGFYRSGDLVRRRSDGNLVVEGRVKDVINRGGDKVPAEEVENILLGHPAIYEVAIVGIPDEALGERTCACVIPRGTPPSQADINTYLSEVGLAAFKFPDRILIMRAFPRTSLGKVNKRALTTEVTQMLSPSSATT